VVESAHQLIILEGNYLQLKDENWRPISSLLDLCIYVDIPETERLSRRIKRHVDPGKTLQSATAWVEGFDNAGVIERSAAPADAAYRPLNA
jgi:pantothenate kinase